MYSKNNKKMIIQKKQEKINYYGIKKFKVGTASVLIAAGFAFLGTNAFASDNTENNTTVTVDKTSQDANLNTANNTSNGVIEKEAANSSIVGSSDNFSRLEKTTQQVQKDGTKDMKGDQQGKKPKGGKLFKQLHTGSWGGWFSRILYAIAAFIGGFLPISGYYLWWKRRSTKKRKA